MPIKGQHLEVVYNKPYSVRIGTLQTQFLGGGTVMNLPGTWSIKSGNTYYFQQLPERYDKNESRIVIRQAKLHKGTVYVLWQDGMVEEFKDRQTVRIVE